MVDVDTSVQVGESMLETFNEIKVPSLRVAAPIRKAALYQVGRRMTLEIRPSVLTLAGLDDRGGQYFESPESIFLAFDTKRNIGEAPRLKGGLHLSSSGAWSLYWFWPNRERPIQALLGAQPDLRMERRTVQPPEGRFRRVLVYTGVSQKTITASYREFLDDMARPAFFQDLRYDSAIGNVIGYKGARFHILEANNTTIRYRVLAPLGHDQ